MRKLIRILTAVSVIMCVATLALWFITSDWPEPRISYDSRGKWKVASGGGRLLADYSWARVTDFSNWKANIVTRSCQLNLPGFVFNWMRHESRLLEARGSMQKGSVFLSSETVHVSVSLPLLVAMFAALPLSYAGRMGRVAFRRWRYPGLCPVCGYDIRATPDRCPECGTPVEVTQRAM